jgi:hypothetical protein
MIILIIFAVAANVIEVDAVSAIRKQVDIVMMKKVQVWFIIVEIVFFIFSTDRGGSRSPRRREVKDVLEASKTEIVKKEHRPRPKKIVKEDITDEVDEEMKALMGFGCVVCVCVFFNHTLYMQYIWHNKEQACSWQWAGHNASVQEATLSTVYES